MEFEDYNGPVSELPDFLAPVEGSITSLYGAPRSGGARLHHGIDFAAPADTPLYAPGNMVYIGGKQGGTNLRDDDYWAHFKDVDSGLEYRFAHNGDISHLQPGQAFQKGEPWGVVGNAIDGTHLHMAVFDPAKKQYVDFGKAFGLGKGQKTASATPFQASFEQAAPKIAMQFEDYAPQGTAPATPLEFEDYDPSKPIQFEDYQEQAAQVAPEIKPGEAVLKPSTGLTEPPKLGRSTAFGTELKQLKQDILNPPQSEVGYRPEISDPLLKAVGLAGGTLVGGAPGSVGGYIIGSKLSDMLKSYIGGEPTPTLAESVKKTAVTDLPEGVQTVLLGDIGSKVIPATINAAGSVFKPLLGKMSGKGTWAIEKSLEGGKKFTEALQNKISGEDIVESARDALQMVKSRRSGEYQTALADISNKVDPVTGQPPIIDLTDMRTKFNTLLGKFVRRDPATGALDWERTTIGNKEGLSKLKETTDLISNWGRKPGDATPMGLDMLKRYVDDLYGESSNARAFIAEARNIIKRTILKEVPEYAEMTKGYEKASTLIKDIESALVKKGQGRYTADMTLRRLTSAMRSDRQTAHDLVEVLGRQGSEDLSSMLAGYTMRDPVPTLGSFSSAMLTGEILMASFINPKLWPILVASSPRVQGEFLRGYGKVLKETKGMSMPVSKMLAWLAATKKESKQTEETK